MQKRRSTRRIVRRVLAVALSVVIVVPSVLPSQVYAADVDNTGYETEATTGSTDTSFAGATSTEIPVAQSTESPATTTEYQIEEPATESNSETTPENSSEENTEGEDEESAPENVVTHPEKYTGMIYSNCDGYSFEDILAMAHDGLDLDTYFYGSVLHGITIDQIEAYIAEGRCIDDVIYERVLMTMPVAGSAPELSQESSENVINVPNLRAGGYYSCQSCSAIGSAIPGYGQMYNIKLYNNVTAFCLEAGDSMSSGATFTNGSALSTSQQTYIKRAIGWYVANQSNSAYAATQIAIWEIVNNGSFNWGSLSDVKKNNINNWDSNGPGYGLSGYLPLVSSAVNSSSSSTVSTLHFYQATNSAVQNVVTWNTPIELHYYTSFQLTKVDSVDGSPVTDAVFEVYQWSDSARAYSLEGTMTYSGANGLYTSDAFEYNEPDNRDAWWKVIETSAGASHVLPASPIIYEDDGVPYYTSSTEALANRYNINSGNPITNAPLGAKVTIDKIDPTTGNAISNNATFTVEEYNATTGTYGAMANAITFTRPDTSSKTYSSSGGPAGDGSFTYSSTNQGKYRITETTAPSGYIGNFIAQGNFTTRAVYYVQVEGVTYNGGAVAFDAATNTYHIPGGQTANITNQTGYYWENESGTGFWNEPAWAKFTVYKQDKESGLSVGQGAATLEGAEYGLIPAANITYPDGSAVQYPAVSQATVTSVLSNIKKMEAVINDTTGTFSEADVATAKTRLASYQATLRGYCVATCTTTYDASTGKVSGVMSRSDVAEANKYQLNFGSYYLVEIKASNGYLLNDTITPVTLTYANDSTIEVASSSIQTEQVAKQPFQILKLGLNTGNTELVPLQGAGFDVVSVADLDRISNASTLTDAELVQAVAEQYQTAAGSNVTTSYDLSMVPNALVYNEDNEGGKLVSTGNANEYRVARLYSDANGYIYSPELPYGRYVVWESVVPSPQYVDIRPFVVTISKDGVTFANGSTIDSVTIGNTRAYQPLRYVVDSDMPARIKVVKVDATTTQAVLGNHAKYKILDVTTGQYVTQKVFYPTEYTVTEYETNDEGYLITPQELPGGTYELVEVSAPKGYVRVGYEAYYDIATGQIVPAPQNNLRFSVDAVQNHYVDTDDGRTMIITINQENAQQLGALSIYKTGEQVVGLEDVPYEVSTDDVPGLVDDVDVVNKQFVYEQKPLAGATFEVSPAETIYTLDGQYDWTRLYADYPEYTNLSKAEFLTLSADVLDSLQEYRTIATYQGTPLIAGTVIATVTTRADGYARITDLPLGEYSVKETSTADGFIVDVSADVTVSFEANDNDEEAVLIENLDVSNERQRFVFSVAKESKPDGGRLQGAVAGIYAGEDIYAYDGTLLVAQDTLLETVVTTGLKGVGQFNLDAPVNCNFYVKEIAAPQYYHYDGTPQAVSTDATEEAVTTTQVTLSNDTDFVMGRIRVIKIDEATQIPLKGVKFELLDEDGNVLELLVTDENGQAETVGSYQLYKYERGQIVGKYQYVLHEVDSVYGYHIVDTDVPIPDEADWDEENPWIEITITNRPNEVRISKKSTTTGVEIRGAILTVIDESTGKIVDSWECDGSERVIKGMEEGTYRLVEKRAAFGYVVSEDIIFEVKDSEVVTRVTMYDDEVMAQLKLKKVDTEGNPLPGTTFVIKDENGAVVAELVCGEDGTAISPEIPAFIFAADGTYSKEIQYTLQETKAAPGYKLDTREFPFTFKYVDDHTPIVYRSCTVTNVPDTTIRTGDATNVWLIFTICVVAGIAGAALLVTTRKPITARRKKRRDFTTDFIDDDM